LVVGRSGSKYLVERSERLTSAAAVVKLREGLNERDRKNSIDCNAGRPKERRNLR